MKKEIQKTVRCILKDPVSIQIFFVLKSGEIELADIDNGETLTDLKKMYCSSVENRLLNENMSIINLSDKDERVDAIYCYDYPNIPNELNPINEFDITSKYEKFNSTRDDIKDITGYLIFLGNLKKNIVLYKKHYNVCLIKRDTFMLIRQKERFIRMNSDIIKLNSDYQFFRINNNLYIENLSVLEKFFGFKEIIQKEAKEAVELINKKNLIDNIEVLKDELDDISFARKINKVKINSPILTMSIPNEQIIQFTKETQALKGKFKYTEDNKKIILDTKKSKRAFLKLMNDDYLKSELTELYYDTLAKDQLLV